MNWHLILGGTSYFDQFQRPPLLRHLWSLAVEEQFYLLWPLALLGLLALFRKRPDRLLGAMVAVALASTVLMAAALPAGRSVAGVLRHGHPHRPGSCSAPAWPCSGTPASWPAASHRSGPAW